MKKLKDSFVKLKIWVMKEDSIFRRFGVRMKPFLKNIWEKLGTAFSVIQEKVQNGSIRLGTHLNDPSGQKLAVRPIRWGIMVVLIFFGVFGLWSVIAPINSASVAPGRVVLSGNKKTIQHLEGGIIEKICVQEGQFVKKGDLLIQLSTASIITSLNIVDQQLVAFHASQRRLNAERDRKKMNVSTTTMMSVDHLPLWERAIGKEKQLFQSRWEEMKVRFDIMEQKVKQVEEEKNGLMAKEKATNEQLQLAREELKINEQLFEKGMVSKPTLMENQKMVSELEGNQGAFKARVAQINQTIAEENLKILDLTKVWKQEATTLLKEQHDKVMELEQKRTYLKGVLERTSIKAPVSGIVTGLKFHTINGVIHPGEPILTIVPQDDLLVIEAQVNPVDIDIVHEGLEANITLNAYKTRYLPKLKGKVKMVSADVFVEESGRSYYMARIALDDKELEKIGDITLYPGMPATTFIITGSRTFLAYLFDPILNSFGKAFREE